MRSVVLIRCLPKMPPSSSTSTSLQTTSWRRSLTWTTSRLQLRSSTTVDGEDVRPTGNCSPNPVQRAILPHRHSQLSDLTIRRCSTTSLKCIKLWLYHYTTAFTHQFVRNSERCELFYLHFVGLRLRHTGPRLGSTQKKNTWFGLVKFFATKFIDLNQWGRWIWPRVNRPAEYKFQV